MVAAQRTGEIVRPADSGHEVATRLIGVKPRLELGSCTRLILLHDLRHNTRPLHFNVRWAVEYQRSHRNFAGDCVYGLQRHFVDCLLSGARFESHGADYLKTFGVVDAVYESASSGRAVTI